MNKYAAVFFIIIFLPTINAPVRAEPGNHVPKVEEAKRPSHPTVYRLLYLRDGEGQMILVRSNGSRVSVPPAPNQRRQIVCTQCLSVSTKLY
jgi:hypothetical protein